MTDWITRETMDELSYGRDKDGEEFWKEWGSDGEQVDGCIHPITEPILGQSIPRD